MQSFSIQTEPENLEEELKALKDKNPSVLVVFSSRKILEEKSVLKTIANAFPDAEMVGCSTSGEIGEGVEDDSVSLMGMSFEKTQVKCVTVPFKDVSESQETGAKIAQALMADDLKGVFVLSPGLNVNGSKLIKGLKQNLPNTVSVSGGLAGDGLDFGETVTVFNDGVYGDQAVAFGLYGDSVKIYTGSQGGWKPFGPLRRVTKVEDNVLFELDGEPVLDLYKEYLGDKAAELPASGLLYPFAIMDGQGEDSVGLIRTILDVNEEQGSLILAGDIELGQQVCLMHANTDELVSGAENAAEIILQNANNDKDGAIICVSCVGRKILMGDDTEEELDVVKEVFGEDAPVTGFYSYGEISHFKDTGETELHNQTMTITYISEKVA